MNESISRAAGTLHGQETSPEEMRRIVRAMNRNPRQRSTSYGKVSRERELAGINTPELEAIINTPARKYERKRPSASLVRNDLIEAVQLYNR